MSASGSTPPQSPPADILPTYEETLAARKHYHLKYPQVLSRSVQAVDTDTQQVICTKKVKGLTPAVQQFLDATGKLLWTCHRNMQGFELVFSRTIEMPPPPPPPESLAPMYEELAEPVDGPAYYDDDIGTTSQLDSKPLEYISTESSPPPPPPAYEESENTQKITLTSLYPLPFMYSFTYPGDLQLKWVRNSEAKNPAVVSREQPWTAFTCVDKTTGRLLAEVVRYSKKDSELGTLVVHGEMDREMEVFLVVSAIPVVEEYPVRHLRYSSMSTIPV
ncbi:hypothetical protein EC988_000801 [Linderina pennispora]|nr:hypothetical protein EC988_000801 [Linderina pennispora]